MKIVTDSKGVEDVKDPENCNVFNIFSHFATKAAQQEWAARYRAGGMGYGEIKQATFEAIDAEIAPFREEYFEIRSDTARMEEILARSAAKARKIARGVMDRVRERAGFIPGASG